jgi:hypothetical protein
LVWHHEQIPTKPASKVVIGLLASLLTVFSLYLLLRYAIPAIRDRFGDNTAELRRRARELYNEYHSNK